MLKKIKNSKVAKWLSVMCVTALIAAFGCLTVFAADGETGTNAGSGAGADAGSDTDPGEREPAPCGSNRNGVLLRL